MALEEEIRSVERLFQVIILDPFLFLLSHAPLYQEV